MSPRALKVSLDAPDGSHWTSVWQPIYADKFLPGERVARAAFSMSRAVYERLKGKPFHAHIVLDAISGRNYNTYCGNRHP